MTEPSRTPSQEAGLALEILLALLARSYGSEGAAREILDRALQRSQQPELPETGTAVIAFVRAHLVPILSDEIGPRMTMALLDDFIADYEVRSGVRPRERPSAGVPIGRIATRRSRAPALRVLLVDVDRVGRAALARALVRASCDVQVADATEDVAKIARSGEWIDVAIVDALHPSWLIMLETLIGCFPSALAVVRGLSSEEGTDWLRSLGATRYIFRSRDMPTRDLVDDVVEAAFRVA